MNGHRLQQHWFFKYKLYHLLFWAIYHYLWWSLISGSALEAASNIFFSPYAFKFIFYVIFQAVGVYFNLYFLIPRFLEKGQFVIYIGCLVFTIACTATLILPGYHLGAIVSGQSFMELYNLHPGAYFHIIKSNTLPSTIASMTLAMSIKLTKNWIQAQRRQQLLEKEKLETELKFLKSQFNPHFLFNTINSIFVLIHKNPDMASESLAKFSDLLRYQLYDCNEQRIPLSHELTYLENFIELERLRQDHNFEMALCVEKQHLGDLKIAPFILMPFIENAFKHLSKHTTQSNWMEVKVAVNNGHLQFGVTNSVSREKEMANPIIQEGGIGLQNVKRRLELLYPGQYELKLQSAEDRFNVQLQLVLQGADIPQLATA